MVDKPPTTENKRPLDWHALDLAIDKVLADSTVSTTEAYYSNLNDFPELEQKMLQLSVWGDRDQLFESGIAGVVPDLIGLSADQESDLDGGTLLSRYRIVETLGSGGMGDVYLAERADGLYEKQVALKIMSKGLVNPVLLQRFRRERQIQAELSHPGIARLLDAGVTDDGRPWYVLDFIQGEPLTTYCDLHEPDRERRLAIFLKLCRAIEYAHGHGVIHRDLKPSNILVEKRISGVQPIVVDFGIASKMDDIEFTQTGQLMSTPAYSAPEQVKGEAEDRDQRVDIFSLGVILYELIDGRRPFAGDSTTGNDYPVVHQATPLLSTTGISPDLTAIIFKCLDKSPDKRYQSVGELITDLENFNQGRSVQANPVGRWFRFRRYVSRRPLFSLSLAATGTVLIAMLSFSYWQSMSKKDYAASQTRAVQYFSRAAREIENSTKLIYSRPVHNIEKELHVLDEQFHTLVGELVEVDSAVRPVAEYALGQAASSIGRTEDARRYLENAWNGGVQEPLVALDLGRVYLQLYADSVQKLSQFSHAGVRGIALEDVGHSYLEPARFYLEKGVAARHEDAVVAKALLQYLDGNDAGAIELLDGLAETSAWPVIALIEAGQIYLQDGERKLLATDYVQVLDSSIRAFDYFSKGAQIARSHPVAIKGQCAAWTSIVQMGELHGDARPLSDLYDITSCDQLVSMHPNSVDALLQTATAYLSAARLIRIRGDNPEQVLSKAALLTNRALELQPQYVYLIRMLGSIQYTRALWLYETGKDGSIQLSAAVDSFQEAALLAADDPLIIQELAAALQRVGRVEYANGLDGDVTFINSNKLVRHLTGKTNAPLNSWLILSEGLSWQAYYRYSSGREAEQLLKEAVIAVEQALKISPENMVAHKIQALATWTYAELLFIKGEDPSELSAQAFNSYQKVIESAPENHLPRFNQLGVLALAVEFSLDEGQAQHEALDQMHTLMLELQEQLDGDMETQLLWADYWRYRAKQMVLDGHSPQEALETARSHFRQALSSPIDRYEAVQSFAALAVFEHEWRQRLKSVDKALLDEDMATLDDAVTEYPDLPILRAWRGRLSLLGTFGAADPQIVRQNAYRDLLLAIEKNPLIGKRFPYYVELVQPADLRPHGFETEFKKPEQ